MADANDLRAHDFALYNAGNHLRQGRDRNDSYSDRIVHHQPAILRRAYTLNSDPDKGPNQYTYVPFYDLTGTSGSPGGNLVIVYVAAPGCTKFPPVCRISGLKIVTNANGSVDISLKG